MCRAKPKGWRGGRVVKDPPNETSKIMSAYLQLLVLGKPWRPFFAKKVRGEVEALFAGRLNNTLLFFGIRYMHSLLSSRGDVAAPCELVSYLTLSPRIYLNSKNHDRKRLPGMAEAR